MASDSPASRVPTLRTSPSHHSTYPRPLPLVARANTNTTATLPPTEPLWHPSEAPSNNLNPQKPRSAPMPAFQSDALRASDEPYNDEVPVMRYEDPKPQRGIEAVRQREARVEGRDGQEKKGG